MEEVLAAGRGAVQRISAGCARFAGPRTGRGRWRRLQRFRRRTACRALATNRMRCWRARRSSSHALISPYLNLGLLDPLEVCRAVEAAWQRGPGAAQRRRRVHPADHRLAGIRARHLGAGGAGLSDAQRAGPQPRLAAGLLGRRDADGLHVAAPSARPATWPMPITSSG